MTIGRLGVAVGRLGLTVGSLAVAIGKASTTGPTGSTGYGSALA